MLMSKVARNRCSTVANNIALTYTFNGVTLTGVSQEVVGDTESNGGMRADLVIAAAKPADSSEWVCTPPIRS